MKRKLIISICFVIIIQIGLLFPWPFKSLPLPVRELLNALHLPLLLVVTLWFAWLLDFRKRLLPALYAASFAILIELLQPLTGRSAELEDLINSGLGILLAELILFIQLQTPVRRRMGWYGTGLVFLYLFLAPVFPPFAAYLGFKQQFPILSEFNAPWYRYLWVAGLNGKDALACSIEYETKGDLPFLCRVQYPGLNTIQFTPGRMDWSEYTGLEFDIENTGKPFDLHIRIDDSEACSDYHCRFNSVLTIPAGRNTLTVSLSENDSNHNLQRQNIIRVVLFTTEAAPGDAFKLYRLEVIKTAG